MRQHIHSQIIRLIFTLLLISSPTLTHGVAYSKHLSVITSANPESNSSQSFVIIKEGTFVKEGIKNGTKQKIIGQQTPFVIEYTKPLQKDINLQWKVKVTDIKHGTITLHSKFEG